MTARRKGPKPEAAHAHLSNALEELDAQTAWALSMLGPAMEWHLEQNDTSGAAQVVADVQALIARLRDIESLAAMLLGKHAGFMEGELTDGRTFKIKRTADRKAWAHDRWQTDARRAVARDLDLPPELANPETGDMVNIYDLMAAIEEVHGAQAPRTGVLKRLGLDPGDYCETVRGTWKLDTVAPSTPTPTTTDSGERNG